MAGGGGGGSNSQSSTTNNSDNRIVGQGESVGVSGSSNVSITQTKTDFGAIEAAGKVADSAIKSNSASTAQAFGLAKDVTSGALAVLNTQTNTFTKTLGNAYEQQTTALKDAYSEAKGNDSKTMSTITIIAGLAVAGVAAVAIGKK